MLEAFVLGFWLVWSANREIYPLSESLWFTIIAVFLRQLTAFELPLIDGHWLAFNGVLWAYVALVFILVNRWSNGFMTTLLMAAAAGIGYFQLVQHLPGLTGSWLV
ncbi:putative membrane protein [Neisseria perflava]|uniref:multidrug transporter MatE n=1 Tax=Neisseria perflava TaxID=33053 RepID=UPI0020A10829|nr:multidrug transporter MatE [Neisseria perflava]MCP1772139.1 putative membrane protein [Neisseria perflava]